MLQPIDHNPAIVNWTPVALVDAGNSSSYSTSLPQLKRGRRGRPDQTFSLVWPTSVSSVPTERTLPRYNCNHSPPLEESSLSVVQSLQPVLTSTISSFEQLVFGSNSVPSHVGEGLFRVATGTDPPLKHCIPPSCDHAHPLTRLYGHPSMAMAPCHLIQQFWVVIDFYLVPPGGLFL